jgi:hypothetical protein
MIDLTGEWVRDLAVTVNTGAANTTLKLPRNVGVRVEVGSGPSIVETRGLTKNGNVYTNAAYGESDVTMNVNIEPGIGQIYLEVEEADE